jgi:hypothetical protein
MRRRLSEREQAPALQSGAGPRSPAHFGVRRLAAALSPRELAVTRERRSLPDLALSPPEWLMPENMTLFASRSYAGRMGREPVPVVFRCAPSHGKPL